jgi:hypothetical protein
MPELDLTSFFQEYFDEEEESYHSEFEEALRIGREKMAFDQNTYQRMTEQLQKEKERDEEEAATMLTTEVYYNMGKILGSLQRPGVRKRVIKDIQTGAVHEGYIEGLQKEMKKLIDESKGIKVTEVKATRRLKINETE